MKKGEIFGLVGPDGSGKTTTMRLITGLYTSDEGRIVTLGSDKIETVKNHLGYVPQKFSLYGDLTVMENILQAQPEIDAVFAHNDEMALGAQKAIEASGREIIIVGFDATDDAVAAVKEGKMSATVAQQPSLIGELGVETAKKILDGESVEDFVPVDLQLVTE